MAMWTESRARREAINAAVHQAGREADAPIVGGVDEPGLLPLSRTEPTAPLWTREHRYPTALVNVSNAMVDSLICLLERTKSWSAN